MDFREILVGVNLQSVAGTAVEELTPDSSQAVARALEFGKRHGSNLTFVHVLAVSSGVRDFFADSDAFEGTRAAMEELVERARSEGLESRWVFLHGKPWEQLAHFIEESKADLIVVGTRQPRGIRRALLGSTAHRVMMESGRPVLIAHYERSQPCARILIASDLTESGIAAVRHGLHHAKVLGCEVEVVHGVENWFEDRWHRAGLVRHIVEREHEEEKVAAREQLEARIAVIAGELDVQRPLLRVESGSPERVICDAARAYGADLVVVGLIGRSGFKRILVGDTADRLLPGLPCSLLTVAVHEPTAPPD